MSDEQLRLKAAIKRRLLLAGLMLLLCCGMVYFRYSTEEEWQMYCAEKQQEAGVQSQISSLEAANAELLETIESNGKELVSFTDDKIKYINLASQLSMKNNVVINKLIVSDVWTEGEMSGMTTNIEVQGSLSDIRQFVESYCSTQYTNRVNVVSCRPLGRYPWILRTIDGERVLAWFDISHDELLQEELENTAATSSDNSQLPAGFAMPEIPQPESQLSYSYDEETGKFYWDGTTVEVDQETLDETPINLEKIFANNTMKAYLVIDFLGRA